MTEFFRITGKNLIRFDAGPTGNYLFTQGRPPRKLSTVLTRKEVLAVLPRLPLGVRPMALKHGLSVITMEFNIQGASDTDMEDREHDLLETLVETDLFFSSAGNLGTRAVLLVKSDGALAYSYKSVFYGVVDELDARDVLGAVIRAHRLEGLRLTLYCEPYWRPEDAIELGPNEVKTASFEEYGGAAGLADHWTALNVPVTTIENTIVLHGCDSQQIDTNMAGEGIASATMVAPAGVTTAVAYAWICRPAAGTDIRVVLRDTSVGADRDTRLYSTAGWQTDTGGGQTWYRVVVSSNAIVPANNHQLWIYSVTDPATTFYVDETMWIWGTVTAPDEWVGHYTIYNHYDPTHDYPNHIDHLNYLDIYRLKGDVDARIRLVIDATVGASYRDIFQIARRTRGSPCALVHFREAENETADSGTWVDQVDANSSNGGRKGDIGNAAGWAEYTIAAPSDNLRGRFKVVARMQTDDIVNTRVRVGLRFSANDTYRYNPWTLLPLANWDHVDLGTLFIDPTTRTGITLSTIDIRIEYQKQAADGLWFDCFMLLPEDESVMQLDQSSVVSALHVFDDTDDFPYWGVEDTNLFYLLHVMKSANLTLAPDRENRLYFLERWGNGIWHLVPGTANWFTKVTMAYLPQFVSPLE